MIESILDECLESIRCRQATIEECLARYPQYAAELKPMLEMALAIEQLPDVRPSEEFKQATRARLLAATAPKADGKAGMHLPDDAKGAVNIRPDESRPNGKAVIIPRRRPQKDD